MLIAEVLCMAILRRTFSAMPESLQRLSKCKEGAVAGQRTGNWLHARPVAAIAVKERQGAYRLLSTILVSFKAHWESTHASHSALNTDESADREYLLLTKGSLS
jgi:hypothetical protein